MFKKLMSQITVEGQKQETSTVAKGADGAGEIDQQEIELLDNDAYVKLDRQIKQLDLDMKATTDILELNGLISATLTSNTGTVGLTLPAQVFNGFVYCANYTITGTAAVYNMKCPFNSIQWEIKQGNGLGRKTFTFTNESIVLFNKYMQKSQTVKDQFGETFAHVRGATETSVSQMIFLPTPAYFGVDAPEQIISEMMMPIRYESSSKLKLNFYSSTSEWCEFTSGASTGIVLDAVPEIRYSCLANENAKDTIYNFFESREVPVWNITDVEEEFDATGTARSKNLQVGLLPANIRFAGHTLAMYQQYDASTTSDVDTAQMCPIKVVSNNEIGLYKKKNYVLTSTSNALQLRSINTFDCLPSEGVSGSVYKIAANFVSTSNPLNITRTSRDYVDFGNSSDYRINVPSIDSGLVYGDTYLVRATIFELDRVQY